MWLKNFVERYFMFANRKDEVCPKTVVETGAYRGDGIKAYLMEDYFDTIHSIELSEQWYNHCKELYNDNKNVLLHLGDSSKILYELDLPPSPIVFYFDAHYSGGPTAGENLYNGCPIIEELKFIAHRKVKGDVVIVDDMRLMGKLCCSGTPSNDPNEPYPLTLFDFRHASISNMFNVFSERKIEVDSMFMPDSDRLVIFIL